MTSDSKEFDRILLDAIDESLAKVFGQNTAQSVDFYIDPSLAPANPGNYARSLEKLLGKGSKVVLDAIVESVSRRSGIKVDGAKNFGEIISTMKVSFNQVTKR